jgi:hypothetical protein
MVLIQYNPDHRSPMQIDKEYNGIPCEVVNEVIKYCVVCAQKDARVPRAPVVQPIISNRCMERLQVDLIDMTHQADGQYRFIMHAKDHFSKYSWLAALKSKASTGVADVVSNVLGTNEICSYTNNTCIMACVVQRHRCIYLCGAFTAEGGEDPGTCCMPMISHASSPSAAPTPLCGLRGSSYAPHRQWSGV